MLQLVVIDIDMKINIKIQSVSDIITNSSSEVFCTIKGLDLEVINEILKPLFPNDDSEMSPTIRYWKEGEWDEGSEAFITVDMPYGLEGVSGFYKAGLEAILDKYFGGHYHIKYEY